MIRRFLRGTVCDISWLCRELKRLRNTVFKDNCAHNLLLSIYCLCFAVIPVLRKFHMTFSQVFRNAIWFYLARRRNPILNINQLRRLAITFRLTTSPTFSTQVRICMQCSKLSDVVLTSSLSSYWSMMLFSFSASSVFSWHNFIFRSLCCSIWAWISVKVLWKWLVISFLFSSSSRARCRVSSYRNKKINKAKSFVLLVYITPRFIERRVTSIKGD